MVNINNNHKQIAILLFFIFSFTFCSNFTSEKYLKNDKINSKFKANINSTLKQDNSSNDFKSNIYKNINNLISKSTSLGFFSKAAIFTSVFMDSIWNNKVSADNFIKKYTTSNFTFASMYSKSIVYTSNNTYFTGGYIINLNGIANNYKLFLAEFDELGDNIWSKYYNSSELLRPNIDKIIETYDKNYTFTGTSSLIITNNENNNLVLAKFFRNGDPIWIKKHNITIQTDTSSLVETSNNNLAIVTQTIDGSLLFIITDQNGELICNKNIEGYTLGPSSFKTSKSKEAMIETSNNTLLFVGRILGSMGIITNIDNNCTKIWSKTIDYGLYNSRFISVVELDNGNFKILGERGDQPLIVEISPQGNVLDESFLIKNNRENLFSLKKTNSKALTVVGNEDGSAYRFLRSYVKENGEFNSNFGWIPTLSRVSIVDIDREKKDRIVGTGSLRFDEIGIFNLPNTEVLDCENVIQRNNFLAISLGEESDLNTSSLLFNSTNIELEGVNFQFNLEEVCSQTEFPTLSPIFPSLSPTDRPITSTTDRPTTGTTTDRPTTSTTTDRPITSTTTDRPTTSTTDRPTTSTTSNPVSNLTDIPTFDQTSDISENPTPDPTNSVESSSSEIDDNDDYPIIGVIIAGSLSICLCLFCLLCLICWIKRRSIVVDS